MTNDTQRSDDRGPAGRAPDGERRSIPNAARPHVAPSVVALLCVALFAGCHSSNAEPSKSSADAPIPRVKTANPKREPLRIVTTQPGRIEAYEEAPLFPKVAGYIEALPVDIGDRVKHGDVLVRIAVPELLDELAQKKALRDQAEAEVGQSDAGVRAAEAALATAEAKGRESKAGIARADSDAARSKAEHARITELAAGGSVTRKLVDEALNTLRASEAAQQEAAARVQSTEAAVREAQANVDKAKSDVTAAGARLKVAEANLARTQTLVSYLEIKAPFDGCVTARHVDTGHYVQPATGTNAKPVMVVARTDRVRIFVDVPENEAQYADKDDKATITVQALRGEKFTGTVARTSWALDEANRTLRVEVHPDNHEGRLRPGMYATTEIVLADRAETLTIPASAVVRTGDSPCVCAVEDGKIVRKPVQLGLRSGPRIEVLEGLDVNDTIVIAEAAALKDGATVEPVSAEAKSP